MPGFPVLEVVAAPQGPAVGMRLELREQFRIGRAPALELTLRSAMVSRHHCGVFAELGGWWLRDLGSSSGVLHNGVRVHESELEHGDFIEVARGFCFRFLTREPDVDVHEPELERELDDERWQVYADWIHEHVDAPTRLKGLGSLAGDLNRGVLQVDWRNELPAKVTLRALSGEHGDWPIAHRLKRLRAAPLGRFVRELEVDLGSLARREFSSMQAARELVPLFDAFPLCIRVRASNVARSALEGLEAAFPEIEWVPVQPLEFTVMALRPMQRLFVNDVEVSEGQRVPVEVGELRLNLAVRLMVGDQLGLLEVSGPRAFGLNEVEVMRAFLRVGDVLTLEPGIALRVGAQPSPH
jgi:pSer/pThr/pTyr-binding forkhead associated (FHA) protein